MSRLPARLVLLGLFVAAGRRPVSAAPGSGPDVQPYYVAGAEATDSREVPRSLAAAVRKHQLRPIEIVDLPGPPAPKARAILAEALTSIAELKFVEAGRQLDAAAADAALTGGAGLTASELDDIYLLRGVAALRGDGSSRSGAWDDFVRAACLSPQRVLDPGRFAPGVVDTWKRALAEVQRRPHATLLVRAAPDAHISVDARPMAPAPLTLPGLPYGEHHIRVQKPGHLPWAAIVPLSTVTLTVDAPLQPALRLEDAPAAAAARRRGAAFALMAQSSREGHHEQLELRLVDVADDQPLGVASAPVEDEQGIVSAVGRLLEGARRIQTRRLTALAANDTVKNGAGALATTPTPVAAPEPRGSWRSRWPVLAVALAVTAGVAVLLVARANEGGHQNEGGFSATADTRGIGR